ncbi:MAG: C4-type zinc ribbon domain-containing protein [Crocinitomicaceae bacterium]|nr:C4-type zinc ribbon domain-containing protein [Crocinitomicaceae bacterium]
MAAKTKAKSTTVSEKLEALINLQRVDSEIDRILTIRGELPLEVEDLEDEVLGLQTRNRNIEEELEAIDQEVIDRKNAQKDAQTAIIAYKEKQSNVRNNREYESLSKEIEFQELEIQLHEKKTKEALFRVEQKKEALAETKERLEVRTGDLDAKKKELDAIIAETQKDEEKLRKESDKAKKSIDEPLLIAYDRLRVNSKNGLAVVPIDRDACGGCFNRIPAQRQLDIMQRKKIIVCEHCGRILVPAEASAE